MTTLQEAARKALACLELYDHEDLASCEARHELRTALAQQAEPVAYITETEQGPMVWTPEMYGEACTYCDDGEFPVPLYTVTALRSQVEYLEKIVEDHAKALAQHKEQQPVCHGCGIPAGDVHMSTCKSGKWPSRVSNGDTAAPAPQPASEMVANFIVSAVVIKDTSTGFNTQNKLYPVSAANSDEATGKALPLVTNDFPEHRLHTMCFIQIAPAQQAQDKSDNYLNGYCTGRTDLLKEQAAPQPAQGGQHE